MTNDNSPVSPEIKSIFRAAFNLCARYRSPPKYTSSTGWTEAGDALAQALKPFENTGNYELARDMLFVVFTDIERRSKAKHEQEQHYKTTIAPDAQKG